MTDDVVLNKCAGIERCLKRVAEEFQDKERFCGSQTQQDAAILNIQRACELALDLGQHIIRKYRLGLPQSAKDIFQILNEDAWIPSHLTENLQRMIGFRNIAVHEYQRLQLPIVVSIIEKHLCDFSEYGKMILQKDQADSEL